MAVSTADITSASTSGSAVTMLTTPAFTITSNTNRAGFIGLSFNNNAISALTGSIGGTAGSAISGTDSGTTAVPRSVMFGVTAPPSGSQTATASWTGSSNAIIGATTTSGVDQTTSFNNGTFATGTATPSSVAITSTSGDLTVDTEADASGTLPSSPTQTSLWVTFTGAMDGAASRGPGTGTTTHQWTVGGTWASSGANFSQAAGGVPDNIGSANITSSPGRFIGWTA